MPFVFLLFDSVFESFCGSDQRLGRLATPFPAVTPEAASVSAYAPPRNAVYISYLDAPCMVRHPDCHRILVATWDWVISVPLMARASGDTD